jgi:hypothetical protein
LAEDGWNSRDPEKIALAYTLNSLFCFCQKPQRSLKPTQQVHTEKPDNSPIADRADFYRCRRRFLSRRRQTENLDAIGCSIGEFRRMVGVSFVITSGNTAAAAFDVKDYPAIKRRPSRDARRAKANPGVWDWKLRNKDYAAPITNRIIV